MLFIELQRNSFSKYLLPQGGPALPNFLLFLTSSRSASNVGREQLTLNQWSRGKQNSMFLKGQVIKRFVIWQKKWIKLIILLNEKTRATFEKKSALKFQRQYHATLNCTLYHLRQRSHFLGNSEMFPF